MHNRLNSQRWAVVMKCTLQDYQDSNPLIKVHSAVCKYDTDLSSDTHKLCFYV